MLDNDYTEENIKNSEEILMDTISTELPQNTNAQKSLILTDTVGVSKEDTKNELSKYNDYYKSFLSRYFEDLVERYGDNIIVLVKIKTESEKDYSYKTHYQKYYYYIDTNKDKIFGVKRG